MKLSILIPTIPGREKFLSHIQSVISLQLAEIAEENNFKHPVEVITDPRKNPTTGEKRNYLLSLAKGDYVWFIDDDDDIFPFAIKKILAAAEKNPDVIGINGIMTTDGVNQQGWEIRLGHPYKAEIREGKEYYLRFPNHITPMKRIHAITQKFPDVTFAEDYHWAKKINDSGILKTQEIVEGDVYHYKVRTKK